MLSIELVANLTHIHHCLVVATVGDESQEAALFDPPLELNTWNNTGCNYFSQKF